MKNDLLSIVVVHYDIAREFPRTLYSLSVPYQRDIDPDSYEIIVVDNGSPVPPDVSEARRLGINVEVITVPDASPSPARAVNIGLNASVGRHVGVMVDGARLASPGLLSTAVQALGISNRAVVGSRGRYLGPKFQRESMLEGYTKTVEDELIDSVDWRRDGYRLFEVSVFDESSGPSWFNSVAESNSIFMSRGMWRELGGFDEAFTSPGGGLVNLDTWRRACMLPNAMPIVLAGEATFHQLHGGVATNAPRSATTAMRDEYRRLRGEDYVVPPVTIRTWGAFVERPPVRELGLSNREKKAMARNYAMLRPTGTIPADPDVNAVRRRARYAYWRTRIPLVSTLRRGRRVIRSAATRTKRRAVRLFRRPTSVDTASGPSPSKE